MKRLFCLCLTILLLTCSILPVYAQDYPVPYYTVIDSLSADISIDEGTGNVTCSGSVSAKVGTSVSITVELQKLVDNRWHIIESWENSRTSYVACTGKTTVEPGYRYRTYVVGYTRDANGHITESGHTSKSYNYPA